MSISETDRLRAKLDYAESQLRYLNRPRDGAEIARMDAAKARADGVLANFGETASPPKLGEAEVEYRQRLLRQIGAKTQRFAESRFDGMPVPALDHLEQVVVAEARETLRSDSNAKPGVLIPVRHRDESGRMITTFEGDALAWMAPFMSTGQVGYINRNPKGSQ
jgi:hypothetical protein